MHVLVCLVNLYQHIYKNAYTAKKYLQLGQTIRRIKNYIYYNIQLFPMYCIIFTKAKKRRFNTTPLIHKNTSFMQKNG